MSFEHFDHFFTFAAAGLGLLLAGGVNLALGRSGRRVGLRITTTLVLCGAVLAGLWAFTRSELAVRAGAVLGAVLLLAWLLGSAWVSRRLAPVVTFLRKPAPRWGLVALGGLGVTVGSGIAFDLADRAAIDQSMRGMELTLEHPESQPTDRAHATTDRGNRIVLREPVAPRAGDLSSIEQQTLHNSQYRDHVIRRAGPTDYSNCHGWVFTGGKFILAPDAVEAIIKENGYRVIQEPQAGDLVVYRQGGTISHTAVVRYVTEGQPLLVEGKWGAMGVFLHPADKSFYGTEYAFYRSPRTGHLLVGLGGSPGPADAANTIAE
jgi:hypothetical protein